MQYSDLLKSMQLKYVISCPKVPLRHKEWHKEDIVEEVEKIYYIRKGKCEIHINDEKYTVSQGEMILIPSNSLISFRLTDKKIQTEQDFLHFDAKIGTKSIFEFIKFSSYKIKTDKKIAEHYFNELSRSFDDPMEETLYKHMILTELVLYFFKKAEGQFIPPSTNKNISLSNVIKYIDEHCIDSDCTVENIAKKNNVSVNHLIRIFKKQYSITPGKYMENIRMERIKKFLIETNLPVNVISSSTGYDSYEVMSKAFKKNTGLSPSAFRIKNKADV